MMLAALAASAGAAARPAGLPPGSRYVAMGSSFAAGSGVTRAADTPPNRCGRSADNFAHQLARRRGFDLVDVSCGGATTANLLGRWAELPPQLDAVTADTRLVTVTIGGNDLGYLAGLMRGACPFQASASAPARRCDPVPPVAEERFAALEQAMGKIVAEVRRRAPDGRIILIDYLTILPSRGGCAATPIRAEDAAQARALAARLAAITARVARNGGAELLEASSLSRGHDACASQPWVNGLPLSGGAGVVPYHPNLAGMTAIADALDRRLRR